MRSIWALRINGGIKIIVINIADIKLNRRTISPGTGYDGM